MDLRRRIRKGGLWRRDTARNRPIRGLSIGSDHDETPVVYPTPRLLFPQALAPVAMLFPSAGVLWRRKTRPVEGIDLAAQKSLKRIGREADESCGTRLPEFLYDCSLSHDKEYYAASIDPRRFGSGFLGRLDFGRRGGCPSRSPRSQPGPDKIARRVLARHACTRFPACATDRADLWCRASFTKLRRCWEKPPVRRTPQTLSGSGSRGSQCRRPRDGLRRTGNMSFVPVRRGIPMRTLVGVSMNVPAPERFRTALAQSWGWPHAVEVLSRCQGSILLTGVAPTGMDHRERMVLFENTLAALLEAFPAAAIHWQPTQQFVRPREFLAAFHEAGGLVWMPGPINVRLFRMEEEDPAKVSAPAREILMDTLGLAALGLLDVECHFRGLDSAGVSRVLYNTAIYLAQQGSVLEDGHTVPGIRSDQKWTCRHVRSLALPDRLAVRLDPGPGHASVGQ